MARQHAFPAFPGVSTYKDRKGETRYRYRHKLINERTLKSDFGTPEFRAEFEAIIDEVNIKAAGLVPTVTTTPKAGVVGLKTFHHAWVMLQASVLWAGLKEPTQDHQRRLIESFLQAPVIDNALEQSEVLWADAPLAEAKADWLQEYYERLYVKTPHRAKHMVEVIRKLYDVAVKAKWIEREQNKAKFIDMLPSPESDANRPWDEEDKAMFEAKWALGTSPRTAYELGLALGARKSDIWRLAPRNIVEQAEYDHDGKVLRRFRAIQWDVTKGRKGKTPMLGYHEVSPRLERALAALTHDMDPDKSFLRKPDGGFYIEHGLSDRMQEWTAAAGMAKGFTLHGLRHTLGCDLAAMGATEKEIQTSLQHASPRTTAHYTRRTDKLKVMKNVAKVQNGETQTTVIRTAAKLRVVA